MQRGRPDQLFVSGQLVSEARLAGRVNMQLNDLPAPKLNDGQLLEILFRGKWRLTVVRLILGGLIRLSEMKRALPDCSKKVLIDTLRDLERAGFVVRVDLSGKTRRVEYRFDPVYADRLTTLLQKLREPNTGSKEHRDGRSSSGRV